MKAKKKRIPSETSLRRYDWAHARRGRFAARAQRALNLVPIDPQLLAEFGSIEALEEALRAFVRASKLMKGHSKRRAA